MFVRNTCKKLYHCLGTTYQSIVVAMHVTLKGMVIVYSLISKSPFSSIDPARSEVVLYESVQKFEPFFIKQLVL